MTVGEKIQFYRKKSGLSQEELGQRLLVSRQTVSLWEMDKTLPTVDNLIRLKEIFGVSIDEILSQEVPHQVDEAEPLEKYCFNYSKPELREIFKKARAPFLRRSIILACIAFVTIIALSQAPDIIKGLVLGIFVLIAISMIKGYFNYKKLWKSSEDKIIDSTYSYKIYGTYFLLNVSKGEEALKTFKVYFSDVERVYDLGGYLLLEISSQSYIVKKSALSDTSLFYALHAQKQKKTDREKPQAALRVASIALFVCSIASIWLALIGVAALSGINHKFVENTWVFFLFTPIPVASVILGFYMKKRGYKYKKNVIAGIIMVALLCIYGSFTFIFSGIYSHDDEPILRVEAALNIDLPEHSHINTQDWTGGTQSFSRGYIYSSSDIYFEEDSVKDFERQLTLDNKWISSIPNNLIGVTSSFCDTQLYDYFIIYNLDTEEFNKLPSQSGVYKFINVLYSSQSDTMMLVEYEIEYTK